MKIVSKLLGHSSMKITQDSYGKVVEKKISLEMERLKGGNLILTKENLKIIF